MTFTRIQNILMILLAVLLVVSCFFCFSLSLMEYLRIFILGVVVTIVFLSAPLTFSDQYIRRAFLAGAYVYLIYALDPNVNSVIASTTISLYRVISALLIYSAFLLWLLPVITSDTRFSAWRKNVTRIELYCIGIVCCISIVLLVLEILFTAEKIQTPLFTVLRGTKLLDGVVLYLLITRGLQSDNDFSTRQYNIMVYGFLVFSAFATLAGGARAYEAYTLARIPNANQFMLSVRRSPEDTRENVLRVFSLNSSEAALVYDAGYYAGRQEHKKSAELLSKAQDYPRDSLLEAALQSALEQQRYPAALRELEALPESFAFTRSFTQAISSISARLKQPEPDPSLYYIAGLLNLHAGSRAQASTFFDEYLHCVSNHANALYFKARALQQSKPVFKGLRMPVAGWLIPHDTEKAVITYPGHLTIVYNQLIAGKVWLIPGRYSVAIYARDDGTALAAARERGFDPTCKVRCWIGSSLYDFQVLSTNRAFKAYRFSTIVSDVPSDIMIEFTNDIYDQVNGWDRNLSISHLEFTREN